jgi:hypothetical protein
MHMGCLLQFSSTSTIRSSSELSCLSSLEVFATGQQGGEYSGYASGNGSNAFAHRAEEQQP